MRLTLVLTRLCIIGITWASFTAAVTGQDFKHESDSELQDMKKHMSVITEAVDKLLEESKTKDKQIKDLEKRVSDLEMGCTVKSEHQIKSHSVLNDGSNASSQEWTVERKGASNSSSIKPDNVNQTINDKGRIQKSK